MELKKLKLKVHSRNFSEEELIVNCEALSKEKWEIKEGDLLEIFPLNDQSRTWRSHLILQVKPLPPDVQMKGGPFSILQEVAVAFSLTGVREVCVRKVDRREVGLDLVELSFKDQYITRSDMWRITCSLLNKCLYSGKHLQQCTMRMQTHCLWYQGEKVTSGAVVTSTRVVFRSTSAQVFLFIQISSEMWDFDPNGEFFFDKAVNGFLRELFVRWREAGCNHDVTIIFFWRLHYDPTTARSLPASSSVREDKKRGLFYEDFFRVIVESTSNSDWSCELINIKKSFLKLKPLIHNLNGRANAVLCKSEEGNVLEAINLALNVLERHHVDTNLQLAGQQIVVLTAGTGYFEIDHKLMQLTNERLVYGGVTTDLVSMRDQPLHAMPMFKFHSKEEEFFSVPHWINYSFYSSAQGCGQTVFQPRIYLSDHLVNTYLWKDTSTKKDDHLYNLNTGYLSTMADPQIPTWVDYDGHDAAIFDLPNSRLSGKVQSSSRVSEVRGKVTGEGSDSPSGGNRVTFHMGDPNNDPFDGVDESGSTSPSSGPNSIETHLLSREAQLTRSLAPPARQRYKSENFGDVLGDKLGSSGGTRRDRSTFVSVGSAEGLRQGHTPWGSYGDTATHLKLVQKKRLTFSNPFDPNRMHLEAPAFQRRWVHVFPTNKKGVAFQIHHEAATDENMSLGTFDSSPQQLRSRIAAPQISLRGSKRGILKHSIDPSLTATERGGVGSPSGYSKKSGLKQSPVNSSPQDGEPVSVVRTGKKGKGSPSMNGSPISLRDKPISESSSQTHTPTSSLQVSATATPEQLRRHTHESWNDRFPTITSENFASVRRTGVDWTSLVEPAHLPITTDFYPAKEILDRDYAQYNTNIVVFREEQDQMDSGETGNEKRSPMWYSDHSNMTTFQAFLEMISQRLSQGFQLTCPPLLERGSSSLQATYQTRDFNTVYLLHEAVERLKDAKKKRRKSKRLQQHLQNNSITVHMGLSHVFHKLVLAFPDISVFIYRQKSARESSPLLYSYQLSSAAEDEFQSASSQFDTTSDDYNWNFLDHHVCGYSDFEDLGESLRSWELRYLLLPKQCPTLPPLCTSSERTAREREALVSNFVRFLEFLNFKKSVVGSKRASILSLKNKQSRRSMPAILTPYSSLASPSPSPTPTPTPTPSHTTTTSSRSRQLSEIEEEEDKKKSEPQSNLHDRPPSSSSSSASVKSDAKKTEIKVTGEREGGSKCERGGSDTQPDRGESGERGGVSQSRPESKFPRHWRRQSSGCVEVGVGKTVHIERSHSGPESPSTTSRQDHSKSPSSLTPHREVTKYSPRTERKKIISKLRKFASDDSTVSDDGGERLQPLSPSVSTQKERETDLESSLDYHKWTSEGSVQEGVEPLLHVNSPLDTILRVMENEADGIDFLGTETGLQKGCFVSMDAVKWLIENVRGVGTHRQASKILQSMITEQMVVHASGDPNVPFLDGYFFYYIPHKETRDEAPKHNLDSSFYIVNRDFDSFSKKWFETEIEFLSSSSATGELMDDNSDTSSPPHSLASSFKAGHPYYMGFEQSEDTYVPPILNRRVELNPDPHFHSSRPEWCYVHYDPVYNPNEAFQLMFQWMIATSNLLSTLIQSWVRNASMCDFNLVAVPVHKSLLRDNHLSTHPFRKPSFIPLSLPSEIHDKWREEEEEGGMCCLAEGVKKLLLAVASRNGFLRDCAQVAPESNILSPNFADPYDFNSHHFYIHHTGTALVQPVAEQPHTAAHNSTSNTLSSLHSTATGPHHLLHPCPSVTSTPLVRSPAKTGRSKREGSVCSEGTVSSSCDVTVNEILSDVSPSAGLRYGFYWHRNYLLPKQKNVPPGLVGRYTEILEKFRDDCRNKDGILNHLYDRLFT